MPSHDHEIGREITRELERIARDATSEVKAIRESNLREMRTLHAEGLTYADAVRAELKSSFDAPLTVLRDDVDRILTVLNRRGFDAVEPAAKSDTPEAKAFGAYIRRGTEALEPLEVRALVVADDPSGGYLVPSDVRAELIRAQREASPLRRLARNLETTAGQIEVPRQTSHTAATWVGEIEQRSETSLTFGSVEIVLHELATFVDVSMKLLEDSAIDIERLLATDLGESFAAAESAAFLAGTGVKQPTGILSAATTGLNEVVTGHATELTADSLIRMVYAVGAQNSRNGRWIMSTDTISAVRQLKDTTGRYLFSDGNAGIVQGQPATLLGYPVEVSDELPAIAANSTPILFGDFARATWVLSKANGGVSILRDPYTQRGTGKIRFHARQRVGFGVVRPEALAKLKVAAS